MNQFWDSLTAPLIDALRPRVILQIGAKDGETTLRLIEAVARIGGTLHVATSQPGFDIEAARRRAGDRLVVHRARGLDVVPLLAAPDLILIDEDPNWYNTHGLLTAIERQADRSGRPFPVVALAQVGWPYARRDSYDEPSAVPASFRQPYERAGVVPGQTTLSAQNGLFADRFNAAAENETQSGVLTALEDFAGDRPGRFTTLLLPMFHGLALLHPIGGSAERTLQPVLKSLMLGGSAAALASDLEAARVALEIESQALRRGLAQAAYRNDALHTALRSAQQAGPEGFAAEEPSAATLVRALLRRLRRAAGHRLRRFSGKSSAPDAPSDLTRLRSTAIFDRDWYVAHNADVAASGMDPAEHYLQFGGAEGRDPGPDFSAAFYLATYPDVAGAGLIPLLHFLVAGAAEGRDPSPAFRTRFYLDAYPDVATAGFNPLEHYIRSGRAEGRLPG